MRMMRAAFLVLFVGGAVLPGSSRADPSYVAANASAPAVTLQNLAASERFWPYQVELTASWQPAGRANPLPAETRAVLIRVESSGLARIDFGRDGVYDVPAGKTDLVARANQVRLGEMGKIVPNLTHAIGPRLIDPQPDKIRNFDFARTFGVPGYLCVFADPGADAFPALAAALSPLRDRDGVMTILIPDGKYPHDKTREQLRALDWRVPFVMDQLAEGYAESLLPKGMGPPAVMLMTPEGRVVFQSGWKDGVASALESALDGAFGSLPGAAE